MKSFLKYTLATITGIIITSILFFFVMLGSFSIMMASANRQVSIGKNSVLVLNTGRSIPERGLDDPFSSFDLIDFTFKPSPGVNDIIKNLEKAKDDERIKGVLIENGPMVNGWGKAEEIRMALLRFKESGKFIISYTENYLTQESYYISSIADKIYLNPASIFEFKGISSEVMFFKTALEKLGIDVEVIRHGRYKGAVEPFMGDRLSDENRSQIERFINNIWDHALSNISIERNVPVEELNRIADGLLTTNIDSTLEMGLVDGLIYRDELLEMVRERCGTADSRTPDYVSMHKYKNVPSISVSGSEGKIAILYAEGTIMMGRGSDVNIGASYYTKIIRDIREKDDYKALVIRINSPGGNALASDQLWREIKLTADKIPVIISMSNYAASGGYYMAAPASMIIAHPTTLTGSIGVFGMFPQVNSLLNDKLGIASETVRTNRFSDYPSLYRNMDNYEIAMIQEYIDNTYEEFVERVSEGRHIEKSEVDKMGEGQVYSGMEALEKGLIDKTGGLTEALSEAASLASIGNYTIAELPVIEDAYTRLMRSLGGDLKMRLVKNELGESIRYYSDLLELKSMSGAQARLPWFLHIF
ncbi:MAG TPA: signal peptide peptidase SppA [Bacteroidales bacterium]|nr:signal peptide peptidase SppA [Bacteroidales bacterium]